MPSSRAVLSDIADLGLNPNKAHNRFHSNGRLLVIKPTNDELIQPTVLLEEQSQKDVDDLALLATSVSTDLVVETNVEVIEVNSEPVQATLVEKPVIEPVEEQKVVKMPKRRGNKAVQSVD